MFPVGRHDAIGQHTAGMLLRGLVHHAREGVIVGRFAEQRKPGGGAVERVVDIAARCLTRVARHGRKLTGCRTIGKKQIRCVLFFSFSHFPPALKRREEGPMINIDSRVFFLIGQIIMFLIFTIVGLLCLIFPEKIQEYWIKLDFCKL